MAIDDRIEELCNEADEVSIALVIEDRRGAMYLKKKEMHLNPVYFDEFPETFIHEMIHFHNHYVAGYNLGINEEAVTEMETQTLMKNPDNRQYVIDYLSARSVM
jgi:hypothetical protein